MYFWPAVREHLAAGNTLADTATRQEQEAKHVLAELDKLEAGDLKFEKLLGKFIVDAREHIAFEETQVWPGLRTALSGGGERTRQQDRRGQEDRSDAASPAYASLARGAQDRRARRGRGRQGAGHGHRAGRRLSEPAQGACRPGYGAAGVPRVT